MTILENPHNVSDSSDTILTTRQLNPDIPASLSSESSDEIVGSVEESVPNICFRSTWGENYIFEGQALITIGRKDKARGISPMLDAGDAHGWLTGVSRKHARISFEDDKFYVTDLNSANGTRINGDKIDPNEPTRINIGDKLSFGEFSIHVLWIS